MREYLTNGSGPTEFLCDRLPIPEIPEKKDNCESQKMIVCGKQAKKRLELKNALDLDAQLNRKGAQVAQGTLLRCICDEAVVFESLSSYVHIAEITPGDLVI